ncbi:hypothetical protein LOTGIDRAFT_239730 [Lottia gigantea]|uniref:Uncharacterized protein n=1 Tax=Lottia gigantea TaxID=225164 RepID=V4ACK2_LOTGI|nr:hypothetical protein LOTGIDRAFT_239730 [Lottia gigantea]ESP01739.1 hypothetical protein LOTGIDRAFT_239730 [Lottia gigantea]
MVEHKCPKGDSWNKARVPRTKELVFSFNRTLHLEVNKVMVEHKCPKGDSWNEARNWYFYSQEIENSLLDCGYVGLAFNHTLSVTAKVIETIDIKIDDTESLVVIF